MSNYTQVHNKRGGQIKRGGVKGFDLKLLNGGRIKINGGWEQNIKEKRRNRTILNPIPPGLFE